MRKQARLHMSVTHAANKTWQSTETQARTAMHTRGHPKSNQTRRVEWQGARRLKERAPKQNTSPTRQQAHLPTTVPPVSASRRLKERTSETSPPADDSQSGRMRADLWPAKPLRPYTKRTAALTMRSRGSFGSCGRKGLPPHTTKAIATALANTRRPAAIACNPIEVVRTISLETPPCMQRRRHGRANGLDNLTNGVSHNRMWGHGAPPCNASSKLRCDATKHALWTRLYATLWAS